MKNLNINNQMKIGKLAYDIVIEARNAEYLREKKQAENQLEKDQAAYNNAKTNEERLEALFSAKSNIEL